MALTFAARRHGPVRYGNSACLFEVVESQKLKIQNETQHKVFVALNTQPTGHKAQLTAQLYKHFLRRSINPVNYAIARLTSF